MIPLVLVWLSWLSALTGRARPPAPRIAECPSAFVLRAVKPDGRYECVFTVQHPMPEDACKRLAPCPSGKSAVEAVIAGRVACERGEVAIVVETRRGPYRGRVGCRRFG